LAHTSRTHDNSEAALGELKLQLVHAPLASADGKNNTGSGVIVPAPTSAASQALVTAYVRAGGRVFAPVALPLLLDDDEEEDGDRKAVAAVAAAASSIVAEEGGAGAATNIGAAAPSPSPSPLPSPSPSPGPFSSSRLRSNQRAHGSAALLRQHMRARQQSSFQLYASSASSHDDNDDAAEHDNNGHVSASPTPLALRLLRQCARLYSALLHGSPSSLFLSPQLRALLDWPAPLGAVEPSSSLAVAAVDAAAEDAVITAMVSHPCAPVLALLRKDEVYFYDVLPAAANAAAAAATGRSGGGATGMPSTSLIPVLPDSRAGGSLPSPHAASSVVQGQWVGRTLRHPLQARAVSLAWSGPGGGVVAVGTRAGLVCLWQLVSQPDAAAAQALSATGASTATAAPPRRLGAWMHVLSHPSHAGRAVTQLSFSPCGRWLAAGCSSVAEVVLFDVSRALACPALDASSASMPLSRPGAVFRDKGLGVDLLRWSPRGDVLVVASSTRTSAGAKVRAIAKAARTWWSGSKASAADNNDASATKTTSAAAASSSKLGGGGVLSVWDSTQWTCTSWDTAAPVADLVFSVASAGRAGRSGGAGASSSVALMALKGSSVVQSIELGSASAAGASSASGAGSALGSASSSSSALRLDFRPVDGLPPSRQPFEAEKRFLLGGRSVARLAWSDSGSRVVATFDSNAAAAAAATATAATEGGDESEEAKAEREAAELAAVVALQRDATRSLQGVAVGAVRGPACPCRGRLHPELLHDNNAPEEDADAASAAEEEEAAGLPQTCRAPNPPLHVSYLRSAPGAQGAVVRGELLAIGWKYGQITFVPLGSQ
jgi:hypothetical protein